MLTADLMDRIERGECEIRGGLLIERIEGGGYIVRHAASLRRVTGYTASNSGSADVFVDRLLALGDWTRGIEEIVTDAAILTGATAVSKEFRAARTKILRSRQRRARCQGR
jgi:hypothetical protein